MNLLGVILSGGKSSRMGTDKGLFEYEGKLMVEYSIELLKPFCNELVISTNNLDYLEFGYQTIPDIVPDIGPVGGMFSVMTMLKAKHYFFISCDVPHNSSLVVKALLENKHNAEIIVPIHSNDNIEPLFGVYSYSVLPLLKKQIDSQNYKLKNLLDVCNTSYFEVPKRIMKKNMMIFKNINSIKDV